MIKRKKMPIAGGILKIIIGIITFLFVFGIFIFISGFKEINKIQKNNNAKPNAINFDENSAEIITLENKIIALKTNELDYVKLSMKTGMHVLELKNGEEIELGYLENTEVNTLNNLLDSLK